MRDPIKVGFCVAYDWYLLAHALPLVYDDADLICLSIDKDRISWANQPFHFNLFEFHQLVDSIDKDNKIIIYEEDFHLSHFSPMENEVRQRNMLAARMGKGGWHIQLDCDEYFQSFPLFVKFLRKLSFKRINEVNVCCPLVTMFKEVEGGFLYVLPKRKENVEFIQIAAKSPIYEHGRRNGNFNILTSFTIFHQSWARTSEEVLQKLNNWGHKSDFKIGEYYKFWRSIKKSNYKDITNFHPIQPQLWESLEFGEGGGVDEFIAKFERKGLRLSKWNLFFINSRNIARLKSLYKKIQTFHIKN